MIKATSAALLVFLLALTGMTLSLGVEAHRLLVHLDGAALRAQGIETKVNATLINLDKGTAVWAASAKDQTAAIEDLATDAHGTLSQVNQVAQSLHESAVALHMELDSLHKTTDAATELTAALTTDARTANETIAAGKPLLEAYTRSGNDLDALLKDNAIHRTLDGLAGVSEHANAISGDFERVSNKAAADYLSPKPWYRKVGRYASDAFDYGALFARHTP